MAFKRCERVKTPTVLQLEAVECGAAALAMVLAYYGRFVPLEELRITCGVSRDGSKAASLVKAARYYGLLAEERAAARAELDALKPPYIVLWNFNHFVVVEGLGDAEACLNDPAFGPRRVSAAEFADGYSGLVFSLKPGPEFKRLGSHRDWWKMLRVRLVGLESAFGYALLAGLLLVVPTAALPVFTQVFVDQVLVKHMQDWLRPLLVGLLIVALLAAGLRYYQLEILGRLRTKLSITLSGQFMWHALRLPIAFYAQRYAGEIAHRVQKNDQVANEVANRLALAAIDVVLLLVYGGLLYAYDGLLASIGLALAIFQLSVLTRMGNVRDVANMRLGIEHGKAIGTGIATLQNIETLKASGAESEAFARWAGYHARTMNSRQALGQQDQLLAMLPGMLSSLAAAMVLGLGGLRVMEGHLTIGMLVAFQGLMLSLLAPLDRLVKLGARFQALKSTLASLDAVLVQPLDPVTLVDEARVAAYAGPSKLRGALEMSHVSFGYSTLDAPLIQDFSLHAEPGQRIAIVGGSGSGKSTIAKLLAGFYTPWSGEIHFDGYARAEVPRSVLTRSVTLVDQDLFFFEGTVRENLTLWDATVQDQDLTRACQDAEIQDVVLALTGGHEGHLLEGASNLSGGQRQRLEIARAIATNPAIVILDEATSALDGETERLIDAHLRKRGCTCIVIAHRLSTIRDADEIIMLERGKVVQRGRHAALMAEDGPYTRLILGDGALTRGAS